MRIRSFLLIGALTLPLPAFVHGQAPAASPADGNLIQNGGFEQVVQRDNLWDGVDADGYLAGERGSEPAMTESGGVADTSLPISVALGDLNGDGLLDLVTSDPIGYYRVYFNSGSKTEPKFTNAEMVPVYISRLIQRFSEHERMRRGPKICLADNSSTKDIVVGVYGGELFRLENKGSAQAPQFSQPADLAKAIIKTSKTGEIWGNLFAPYVFDWNHDGRPDILLGEGSYSANAVHLLLSDNSAGAWKFSEDKRYYLCYGDGREQLTPCVVDYNGDGIPDVLVGDRKGTIAVHLGVQGWKPGMELKQASLVTFGATTQLNGLITVAAGDLNGDGLFDLVIGRNNGRISYALNKGTKEQPKFDGLTDLKGTDLWKREIGTPSGWSADYGLYRGNIYGFVNCVTKDQDPEAVPAEGQKCLKVGYNESPNKVLKFSQLIVPPNPGEREEVGGINFAGPHLRDAWFNGYAAPTNTFVVQRAINKVLDSTKTYQLSFKVKGRNFNGKWYFGYRAWGKRSEDKVTNRGDRGQQSVERDEIADTVGEDGTMSPGSQWVTVTRMIHPQFKNQKEFNNPQKWSGIGTPVYVGAIEMQFTVGSGGVAYVDDVELVQK